MSSNSITTLTSSYNNQPLTDISEQEGLRPAHGTASVSPQANIPLESPASADRRYLVSDLITQLQKYGNEIVTLNSLLGAQRQLDRRNGVGLIDGARQFSLSAADILSPLIGSLASGNSQVIRNQIDSLGQGAQKYLLGSIKDEALGYLSGKLGLDASRLTFDEGVDVLGNFLSSGEISLSPDLAASATQRISAEAGTTVTGAGTGISAGASKILGAAGAAYSVYNLISGFGHMSPSQGALNGATAGAYIGSIIPGVGTLIGGAVGGVVGAIASLFKNTGKDKDQLARDKVRDFMQQNGMLDKNWNVQLANGALFDMGKDGGARLTNSDGSERRMYDVDAGNPLSAQVVGLANPLAYVLCGGDRKLATDFAGYFTNAALSNASDPETARQNMLAVFQSMKVAPEQILGGLSELAKAGKITSDELQAFAGGVQQLLTPVSYEYEQMAA